MGTPPAPPAGGDRLPLLSGHLGGWGTVAEGLSTRVKVRKPGLSRVLLLTLASHRTQSQTAHL